MTAHITTCSVARPILTADDYAMTPGVSDAIETLAREQRLSATSVMTNMPSWPERAPRLRQLRHLIATGLHLNLTVGRARNSSTSLAPSGTFRPLRPLMTRAVARYLDPAVITDEIRHQLDLFEQHLGYPPDHIDGHQHVHILPIIRSALISELAKRYRTNLPLFRIPSNRTASPTKALAGGIKPLVVKALGTGTDHDIVNAAMPANTHFSGFSTFDVTKPFAPEIERELSQATPAPDEISIVMCHPGFPDAELEKLDPITTRRRQEFDALMALPGLPGRIWHPQRNLDGPTINWPARRLRS